MDVLVKALTLVAIIAVGYLVKRLGWLQTTDFRVLVVVTLRVTLPCALLTSFDAFDVSPHLLWLTLFGFGVVVCGQLISLIAERRRGPRDQAFAVMNVTNFNIGLFALPYLATLVGPQAMVLAAMFDVGNSLATAGVGYATGMALSSGTRPTGSGFVKTMMSSPVFITYVGVLALGLSGLHLPVPVLTFTATVGAANTFLAMFMIGVGLELALSAQLLRRAARYLALRLVIVTAALTVLWFVLPFAAQTKGILSAVLVAPMAAMVSGFTQEAGLDVRLSTFMTTVTVLVGIVAVPAVILMTGAG